MNRYGGKISAPRRPARSELIVLGLSLLVLLGALAYLSHYVSFPLGELGIVGVVMLFSLLGTLAFWVVVIAGAVFLVRALSGARRSEAPGAGTALDILERRYAAGELTREQYLEMRADLGR